MIGSGGSLSSEIRSFLHVRQDTVLKKVLCFDAPARLGTKGADLRGIANTNLPFLVNQPFLVHKQNYKLALLKLTKRQVEAIQTCLPLLLRHPNQASSSARAFECRRVEAREENSLEFSRENSRGRDYVDSPEYHRPPFMCLYNALQP